MAQQQMTADLLPFSAFHVRDVSGRVGPDPSHEERALEYGTLGWSSTSCFPFPNAAWLRRGNADAKPGPIYRLPHSIRIHTSTTLTRMFEDYAPPSEDSLANVFASLELPAVMGVVPIPARVRSKALLLQTLEARSQERQQPDEISRAFALLPRLWYLQAPPTKGCVAVAALGGG
eukprot:3020629-Pleurochrysis_carterae.AAC.5